MSDYFNPYPPTYYPNLTPSYLRPQQPQVPAPQIQNAAPNQVTFYYVQGKAAADNWLLGRDEKVYLMDSTEPVLYLKATDRDGRYLPMETYDLVKRTEIVPEQTQFDTSSFVTRDEISALIAKEVDRQLSAPSKKEV